MARISSPRKTSVSYSPFSRETICVSGGRIGLQVELAPEDLGKLVPFTSADIAARED